ncbi:MAG: tRNA (N6-threonylcarbamoyladenosine(37)-N6)-methyltransferase TrmO [Prevotella sp.]|nr:tRNA (N6-threonylcarbamoyladenosine(37)-N6)-methyltransferase TrmO [Prevotella sp.]
MTVRAIATFHSPVTSKFGVPRQSGIVETLKGEIVFLPEYRNADFIRGLEEFEYIWLLWAFSENSHQHVRPLVRPPLLGGNTSMGVFATRSPYRPNPIGLSSVRIESIVYDHSLGPVIHVLGADLVDGTPIIDIKPYVEYADAHVGVRNGFVDSHEWRMLDVTMPDGVGTIWNEEQVATLRQLLALDPCPHYHDDPQRVYGMTFYGYDVRFRVADGVLTVMEVVKL